MTSDCKTSLRLRTVNIKDHLVERENIEPGALVPGGIQRDSHCILLQQGRESLVDGKIFVWLDVQQLDHISVLGRRQWGYNEDLRTLPTWMTDPMHFLYSVSFCFFSTSAACWKYCVLLRKECFMRFVCNIITWNQLKVKIMKLMVNVRGKFSEVFYEPSITWSYWILTN